MPTKYAELHELVDQLTPDQADAVQRVMRQLVTGPRDEAAVDRDDATPGRVRRLSFAGTLHSGRGDLASRAEEIIRDEHGR